MSNVVLITGVSRYLGGRLAAHLAADPAVERIIGVDTVPPARPDLIQLGRTEFVRADIRNPLIAKVLAQAHVDTVVHASVLASPRGLGGRVGMKEMNLIGTMQLLAACQKSDTISRLVLASTTAVYGSSSRDPAVFTEDAEAAAVPRSGYASDAVEVEGYVRGFGRRRADVALSVLRFAHLIGPTVGSPICRYLALPVVPTALGFDPRVQLLQESDAVEALRLATVTDRPGVVNVAADGVVSLAQAVRRAGRLRMPLPARALDTVGGVEFATEQRQFLNFGRVVDTTRLHEQFGYQPRYTTEQALQSFLDAVPAPRVPIRAGLSRVGSFLAPRVARGLPSGVA